MCQFGATRRIKESVFLAVEFTLRRPPHLRAGRIQTCTGAGCAQLRSRYDRPDLGTGALVGLRRKAISAQRLEEKVKRNFSRVSECEKTTLCNPKRRFRWTEETFGND